MYKIKVTSKISGKSTFKNAEPIEANNYFKKLLIAHHFSLKDIEFEKIHYGDEIFKSAVVENNAVLIQMIGQ